MSRFDPSTHANDTHVIDHSHGGGLTGLGEGEQATAIQWRVSLLPVEVRRLWNLRAWCDERGFDVWRNDLRFSVWQERRRWLRWDL